uniref:long-chain-fatty-acid--CoA ligase n=1 Tax=Heligmosomoides polygyrus TaxID=6339 RepID=A0A183GCX2_HELPZ
LASATSALHVYTSGTTGTPKGVVITHRNILANISAWIFVIDRFIPEAVISYLPLSHMMEQVTHWTMLIVGARLGYFSGSIPRLLDDINALRPTAFPVVPRLLNRLYDAIQSKVQKGGVMTRMAYRLAYSKKLALLKKGITTKESLWDRLVFNKVQAQIGGRVHTMATGSAPISAEVLETCRVALGVTIVEAYGQTECTAMATMTWPGDWQGGHCGGVAPCCNFKLIDVPELNYYAKDGKGEIMIRGPSVSQGYYKDPEKTAELFDEQGFLHTGDVGELLPNGTIRIIDRKKHIFKLAQGEYVAPEKIENVYIRSPVLQQIFVDGNSLERWLIAVVVPEPKVMEDWNERHGKPGRSLQEICSDQRAHDYVLSQLQEIGKENKLNSIEQVKRVYLELEPFTVENGLLTPTLKSKRPQLRQKYKDVIARIYEENRNL